MSSACCPPGSWPALKPDNTDNAGTVVETTVGTDGGKVKMYTTGDCKSSRAVLLIPDIWDYEGGRTRAVADTLASAGYYVVHPSIFRDGPPDLSDFPKLLEWLSGYPFDAHCRPILAACLEHLAAVGVRDVFLAGFCWGCWVAMRAAALPAGDLPHWDRVRGLVHFHPSIHLERAMGGDDADVAARTRVPSLFLTAGNDQENVRPGGALVTALAARPETAKSRSVDFPDMKHGWVPRGDIADAAVLRDVRKAIEDALAWMKEVA
eukprot:TRINITY_DN67888_c0_g1_i1.p1 TRINITY_DN67888_c0_g1~~TRINITY_DN67888_c0_g1_i1.p1  ORF type:complete len:264 (+),score=36.61 TRINITY_DN67888_c0_g1_i1:178-969(+)